jgi:hypothetical protein
VPAPLRDEAACAQGTGQFGMRAVKRVLDTGASKERSESRKAIRTMPDPQILTIRLDQITVDARSDVHRVNLDLRYLPLVIPKLTDIALECLSHLVPISVRKDFSKRTTDRYSLISGFRTYQLLCAYLDVGSPCMVHCYQRLDPSQLRYLQVMDMSLSKLLICPNDLGISVLVEAMLPDSPWHAVMQELVHLDKTDDRPNLFGLSRRRFQEKVKDVKKRKRNSKPDAANPVAETVSLGLPENDEEGDDNEY